MKYLMSLMVFCLANIASAQQTNYISDRLLVNIFAERDQEQNSVKTIASGTIVEVLERDEMHAKIRLPDGTEGWTRAAFITNKKPTAAVLREVQIERDTLREQLANTEESVISGVPDEQSAQALQQANREIIQLKERLTALGNGQHDVTEELQVIEKERDDLQQALNETQEENKEYQQRLSYRGGGLNRYQIVWLIVALFSCAGFGFLLGYKKMAKRMQDRFGGYKVW